MTPATIHDLLAAASPGPWVAGQRVIYQAWGDNEPARGPRRHLVEYSWDISDVSMAATAALMAHAVVMAEALASIAANTCCERCQEAALVARECLDKIVKEANHG